MKDADTVRSWCIVSFGCVSILTCYEIVLHRSCEWASA